MKAVLLPVMLLGLALGGCASKSIEIRTLPADTPVATNAAAADSAAALAAAMATESADSSQQTDEPVAPPVTPADAPSMYTYDPWERLNRFNYRFNYRFDEAVFLPVANGYRRFPAPIRAGVHNFFGNLSEVDSVVNYAIQWRLKLSALSLGRFVINSTIGIGGLFDVAKKLKVVAPLTGFGTTLSKWGLHPGPYLVIPILGPSTLRDGLGLLGDYGLSYGINVADLYRGIQSWALGVTNAVDERANISFRYYATGSPFEYETIRFFYVRKRLIEDEGLHKRDPARKREVDKPAGQ
jgi:phospholipid-binding lipoprotein MlaA